MVVVQLSFGQTLHPVEFGCIKGVRGRAIGGADEDGTTDEHNAAGEPLTDLPYGRGHFRRENVGCKANRAIAKLVKDRIQEELEIPVRNIELDLFDDRVASSDAVKAQLGQFF